MANEPHNLQQEVARTKPFDSVEQEVFLNLVRTASVLNRRFESLFREHRITGAQFNALSIVVGAGREGIFSERIGQRLITADPDTTRIVDRLIKQDLAERDRAEHDRRCVIVRATEAGRNLVRKLKPKIHTLHRKQLGHLTEMELRQLNDLLFRARQG